LPSLFLVLAFPALMAAAFILLFFGYRSAGHSSRFDDHGFYWYPVVLLVPLAAVLANRAGRIDVGNALSDLGGTSGPLLAAAAVALGVVLYLVDATTANFGPAARARQRATNTILEGRFAALQQFRPAPAVFLTLAVLVVGTEEIVWRAYLIRAIQSHDVQGQLLVTALAAAAYGLNHYYFGLRNVLVKSFHGLVWGIIFVRTGSLLVPLVSHMTFEVLVGRQFWRRAPVPKAARQR
jgi:membrane protease YdiL (CAAX protease family)